MRQAQSGLACRQLSKEIPPVRQLGIDARHGCVDTGMNIFKDDADRTRFLEAVIAVATNNGSIDLKDHEFKLFYSRRQDDQDRIVARLVATKHGIITAKIEPEADGEDQRTAFLALKIHIEVKLDQILQSVPDTSSAAAGPSTRRTSMRVDAPPQYRSAVHADPGEKKG